MTISAHDREVAEELVRRFDSFLEEQAAYARENLEGDHNPHRVVSEICLGRFARAMLALGCPKNVLLDQLRAVVGLVVDYTEPKPKS